LAIWTHSYPSIPSPRKQASYDLSVDALKASIPRRGEWRPKRKESSTDMRKVWITAVLSLLALALEGV
jgi:hypothetical protein